VRFVEHFLRKNIDYISEENAYQHELHDKVFCQKNDTFCFFGRKFILEVRWNVFSVGL